MRWGGVSVARQLRDLLESLSYEVLVFASAAEMLASEHAARAHCLIVDVRMPEMSGPELQRRLRELGSEAPIVFISSDTDDKLRTTLRAAGAVEYLVKPFDDDILVRALEKALEKRRSG